MPPESRSKFSPAYAAFVASMTIDVEKWRNGIGFDLDALKEATPSERESLVEILGERLAASLSAALLAVQHGATILRVHDVRETRDALAVMQALEKA